MAVRNFWITARIDGKDVPISGGPRTKEGGFDLSIAVRQDGVSVQALDILGRADANGDLVIKVRPQMESTDVTPRGNFDIHSNR